MRASRSPMGSVIAISVPSLPARLGHARDVAKIGQIPKRNARQLELAVIALGAAGEITAMMNARFRRIARKLGELQVRAEALVRGDRLVARLRLQCRTLGGILRNHLLALLVPVDLALLCHLCCLQFMNGNWKPSSKARASASVFADVLMMMSMPHTVSVLS